MTGEFIGREREITALTTAYQEPHSAFWPVYGRRRIGKTELIRQFLVGRPGPYFMGKQAPAQVAGRWRGPGKLVLALDEFQSMAAASPELPSVLQSLWDGSWSAADNVFLIVCGSYVGFMEREVLGRRAGIDVRQLGCYVQQLLALGYLRKRQPLLPGGGRRRAARCEN